MNSLRHLAPLLLLPLIASGELRPCDIESKLAGRLAGRGLSFGFDAKSGRVVVCGFGRSDAAEGNSPSLNRDLCHRVAYLDAQAKILEFMRLQQSGDRQAAFSYDGTTGFRDVAEVQRAFASGVLVGDVVLDAIEAAEGNDLLVGVVLKWSPADADVWRQSLSGARPAAARWKTELEEKVVKSKGSFGRNSFNFIDSSGTVHPVGAGRCAPEGDGLFQEASLSIARAMARKNLLLALDGNGMVREECRKSRRERYAHEGGDRLRAQTSVESFYAKLATLEWKGVPPAGVREVCQMREIDARTGRREVVVLFSLDGCPESGMPVRERSLDVPDGKPFRIFNPMTGKFEQRTEGKGER